MTQSVAAVMSPDVQVVEPQETLRRAAELMSRLDVGALPVCSGGRLMGMVTDRDIVVRGIAAGLSPDDGCVSDAMTPELLYLTPEQDTEEALRAMAEHQVRRLPVVDPQDNSLVGIVSIGDLSQEHPVSSGPALSEISEKE